MNYPNNMFVIEHTRNNGFGGVVHQVIIVAASSDEVAKYYVKEKTGVNAKPLWLMNSGYPTIYNQTGNKPEDIQAKILYNHSCN